MPHLILELRLSVRADAYADFQHRTFSLVGVLDQFARAAGFAGGGRVHQADHHIAHAHQFQVHVVEARVPVRRIAHHARWRCSDTDR